MLTQQQIQKFRQWATSKGYNEAQISTEIARKIQENSKQNIQSSQVETQPAVNPQKGTLLQTLTGGKGVAGAINNVGKFIAPATQNIMQDTVASSVVSSKDFKKSQQAQKAMHDQAMELVKKAKSTKDPVVKAKLLSAARKLNNQDVSVDTQGMFSEDINKDYASRALASGTEIGTLLTTPAGKGKTAVQRTLSAAKQGAVSSAARTATSTQEMTPEERLKATGTSALVGGAITGGTQLAGELYKVVKGAGEKIEAGGNKVRESVRQIKQPASVYGAGKEKAINKTLTKRGFTGSPGQQYDQLEGGVKKLETEIIDEAKANPDVVVKVGDIKTSFMKNLKSSLRTKALTAQQAKSEIDGYLKDLIKASGGKGKFTNINLERLRNLKKLVNEDYGPVYEAMERGTALSPREKVVAAAWDSLDEAIKDASPKMKELLQDESNLYRAAKSLYSARYNPPTLRAAGTSIPGVATQAATDVAGRTIVGAGKLIEKMPDVKGTVVKTIAGKAAPIIADNISRSSTEQIQNENQNTQDNSSQNNSTGDLQHEDSIAPQSHPLFGKVSKQELLLDAFKSGANDAQLSQIEKIYDRFSPQQGGVVDEGTQKAASSLRSEYLGQTKQNGYMDIVNSYRKIAGSSPNAQGDMSMIYAYMKMLDPGSTVREGEYAQAEQTAGIDDKVRVMYNKAIKGEKLSEEQRKNFKAEAKKLLDNSTNVQSQIDKIYTDLAKRYGIDPTLVGIGAIKAE